MSTSYDIEICDHCGSEFEVGYWRNDQSLCEECLSMASDLPADVEPDAHEPVDFDVDDWAPADFHAVDELGFEATLNGC